MNAINLPRTPWKEVLRQYAPLILASVHDALTARIAELAGMKAVQVGGFALSASLNAAPDIDLEHFGEKSAAAQRVIHATQLPVLVDGDDGYGDARNATRTVQEYEAQGAAAIFLEGPGGAEEMRPHGGQGSDREKRDGGEITRGLRGA